MENSAAPEPSWRIRPFRMSDYAAVYKLWQQAGPGVHLRPSDQPAEIAKKLERDPDLFLVAECRDRVVGVIMGAWDGRRGWLHHLAVAAPMRRQGIASDLIHTVETRLRAKGCLKINLLVIRGNQEALRLYQDLGYERMEAIIALGKTLETGNPRIS